MTFETYDFRKTIEDAEAGYFFIDRDGLFQHVNEAWLHLHGYDSADEIIGRHFATTQVDADLEQAQKIVKTLLSGGSVPKGEFSRRCKDGSIAYHTFSINPVVRAGKVIGLEGFLIDSTERRRTEDSLRFTQFATDHASDAIFWMGPNARFIYVNEAACQRLGYTKDELLALSVYDIGPDWPSDTWPDHWRELKENGSLTFETRHQRKDGSIFPVEIMANFLAFGDQEYNCSIVRDMTERERTRQILLDSESRFRTLFDSAVDGILVADPATRKFREANGATCRMLGYRLEEIRKLGVEDIHPTEDLPYVLEQFKKLATGELTNAGEIPFKRKDGTVFYCDVGATPLPLGGKTYLAGFFRDITESRKTAAALRTSEEKYRNLVETSGDLIFECDMEGRFTYLNQAWKDVLGYPAKAMIGHPFAEFKPPEIAERDAKTFRETLNGRDITGYETVYLSDTGARVDLLFNARIVRDPSGDVLGTQGTAHDITDRKHAEKMLIESEEKYKTLFERDANAIFIYDPDTTHILDANEATSKMYGYEKKELLGMSCLIFSVEVEKSASVIDKVREKGDANVPLRYHRKRDGTVFPVDISAYAITVGGKEVMFAVSKDITERKRAEKEKAQLEERYHQAQKMESIGRLAGGVAHDFNNLLTTIIGYSDIIESALASDDPLAGDVKEILNASGRATQLTQQLLAFSRKQTIDPKVVDVNELIKRSQKMLERLIEEDIVLRFVPAKDLWQTKIDPGQLDQILLNLAVNARDAMPDGGKLTIETANFTIDDAYCATHHFGHPGEFVMLTVSDDGAGMEKDVLSDVFEPFFTTKTKGKGTGLGLSTVYGIVKQHGGFINVRSEPGEGTSFMLYMPRILEEIDAIDEVVAETPIGGAETILLAEDDEQVRKLTVKILRENGYIVLEADNGAGACQKCRDYKNDIHILLTDVVMPEMNGKESYDRIASFRPGIKVLYLSGYTDDAIAHRGVLDEGTDLLQKPFKAADLLRKVREVLDG